MKRKAKLNGRLFLAKRRKLNHHLRPCDTDPSIKWRKDLFSFSSLFQKGTTLVVRDIIHVTWYLVHSSLRRNCNQEDDEAYFVRLLVLLPTSKAEIPTFRSEARRKKRSKKRTESFFDPVIHMARKVGLVPLLFTFLFVPSFYGREISRLGVSVSCTPLCYRIRNVFPVSCERNWRPYRHKKSGSSRERISE